MLATWVGSLCRFALMAPIISPSHPPPRRRWAQGASGCGAHLARPLDGNELPARHVVDEPVNRDPAGHEGMFADAADDDAEALLLVSDREPVDVLPLVRPRSQIGRAHV